MKRQRFRGLPYENLDKTCYKWLVNTRGQNIPISATMLKTKALFFARELGCNDLRALDCWLDQWKKRKNVSFKTISGIFTYFFFKFLTQDVCKFIETSETKHDTKMCLHSNIRFIGTFELDLIRIPVSIQLESAKI